MPLAPADVPFLLGGEPEIRIYSEVSQFLNALINLSFGLNTLQSGYSPDEVKGLDFPFWDKQW